MDDRHHPPINDRKLGQPPPGPLVPGARLSEAPKSTVPLRDLCDAAGRILIDWLVDLDATDTFIGRPFSDRTG